MLSLCLALTTHLGLGDGWNEVHPCVRYEQDSWTVGAFLNSENALSAYASYTWQDGPWFAEVGIASGYSAYPIVPLLRVGYELSDHVSLFISPAAATRVVERNGRPHDLTTVGVVLGVEYKL